MTSSESFDFYRTGVRALQRASELLVDTHATTAEDSPFPTSRRQMGRTTHHPNRRFHSSHGIGGSRRGNGRKTSSSFGRPKPKRSLTSVKQDNGALGMSLHS